MGISESEKAQDQDLVLMIGNTGVGKSTAVNYLNGREMARIKNNGRYVIVVKQSAAAQSIAEIGHGGDSKTFIPAVIQSTIAQIAFCDCPGFSDNRGEEINISNAVNIRHTIKKAKSVKIIVLIDYASATDSKGTVIRGLMNTLDALFGEKNSLMRHASSIQMGITQVPLNVEDEPVTLQGIQEGLSRLDRLLPDDIIRSIKILDPLERRVQERCARTDWLAAINALTPVANHQDVFKTTLNSADTLMLMAISKEMSKQIRDDLSNSQYQDAAQKLEQMERLRIIGQEAIEALYQENLATIGEYAEALAQQIKKHADQYEWSEAYNMAQPHQEFVARFQYALPALVEHFAALIDYISTKQIERHTALVIQSVNLMVRTFDQNISLQRQLAYSLLTLLSSHSLPDMGINRKLLKTFLSVLAENCEELSPLIEELVDKLAALQILARQLNKNKIMVAGEIHLIEALTHIADVAQRVHKEMTLEALKDINIVVLQQIGTLKSKITWKTNGRNILPMIQSVKSEMSPSALIELLKPLSNDASIATAIELLISQLKQASDLIAHLNTGNDSTLLDETRKPFQIIHRFLLQTKSELEEEKRAEETRLRKERDRAEVKSFIQKAQAMIQTTSFRDFDANRALLNTFNAEQLALLREDKEISLLLIEKLHASCRLLKTKITWETNGRRVFTILKAIKDPQSETHLKAALQELEQIDDIKTEAAIIGFGLMIHGECKAKLNLDTKAYLHALTTHLTYIHGELNKKYAEELKTLRINYLLGQINNRFIPNSEFTALNEAILNLLALAPDQLKTITLKTKVDEHKRVFYEQLSVNNYAAAKEKLELLSDCEQNLRGVLPQCKVTLDINELISAIIKHLTEAVADAQKELRDAFSEKNITTLWGDIHPLETLSRFFNACAYFQNISGVNALSTAMAEHCMTLLGSFIRQYSVNSDPNIYIQFLMQVESTADIIGSSNPLLSTRIRHAMVPMIAKHTAEKLTKMRVNYWVGKINNELIPNSKFEQLNKAILNLLAIAPDQLQNITLKSKVDEHKSDFYKQLNADFSNFIEIKRTFELLYDCERCLKGILPLCQVSLELNELLPGIVKKFSDAAKWAIHDLSDAFSEDNFRGGRKDMDISPLGRFDLYFMASADFQSRGAFQSIEAILKELSTAATDECMTFLGTIIRQYSVNSDPNIYIKVLMQIEGAAAVIDSSNPLLSTRIRSAMEQMSTKNNAEELTKIKVNYWVGKINNHYIPDRKTRELNVAIMSLLAIAPDQIKNIPLKTTFDENKRFFYEELSANSYEIAARKLYVLYCYARLWRVFPAFQVSFDMDEFCNTVTKHISEALDDTQKELRDAFSSESIATYQREIHPLMKLGAYINACTQFQNIKQVNTLCITMLRYCGTLLSTLIQQYSVNSDSNVYTKFLMQVARTINVIITPRAIRDIISLHDRVPGILGFKRSTEDAIQQMIERNTDVDFLRSVHSLLKPKPETHKKYICINGSWRETDEEKKARTECIDRQYRTVVLKQIGRLREPQKTLGNAGTLPVGTFFRKAVKAHTPSNQTGADTKSNPINESDGECLIQ